MQKWKREVWKEEGLCEIFFSNTQTEQDFFLLCFILKCEKSASWTTYTTYTRRRCSIVYSCYCCGCKLFPSVQSRSVPGKLTCVVFSRKKSHWQCLSLFIAKKCGLAKRVRMTEGSSSSTARVSNTAWEISQVSFFCFAQKMSFAFFLCLALPALKQLHIWLLDFLPC